MVIGSERMRRPVAWYTALAIAAAVPGSPISPTPFGADRGERVGFADEDDLHVGHVGVDGNEVVGEGGVRDPARSGVGDGLLEQRLADAADGAADDLAAGQLLVEDPPSVDHRHDARDAKQAELGVDADLDELGREGARQRHAGVLGVGRRALAVRCQFVEAPPGQDVGVGLIRAGVVPAVDASPSDRDVVDRAVPQRRVGVVGDRVEEPLEERLAGGVHRGTQRGGES
jgi:hypothetical protein